MKTVFFGTPEIGLSTLQVLYQNPHIDLSSIVSMPSRRAGRGMKIKHPAVAQFALDHQIPLLQTAAINKEEEFLEKLESENIDLIIVFAFSQFLSERILKLPKQGCFNIHTSLLPKYRGAAPIQYALLNGDPLTGITIQKMAKKMDAGDIALTQTIPIDPKDNADTLHEKIINKAPPVITLFINQMISGDLLLVPQSESDASFAPMISKQDGHLQFADETFAQIENRIRAFDPWPGTFCYLNEKRIKVFSITPSDVILAPGKCDTNHGFILVGSKDKTIRLKFVQLEGKKPCLDYELLNGIRDKVILS